MKQTVTSDGASIAWNESGTGEPLILISGQSISHKPWLHLLPLFTDKYRVIYFDHRGIGASSAGDTRPYSIELFASDVLAIMADAGIEAAHIYGHSMGGRVAQRLAIAHPEKVLSLVLAATTPGESSGILGEKAAYEDLYSGCVERMMPHFFSSDFTHCYEDLAKGFFKTKTTTPDALKLHYQASCAHDSLDDLENIEAPTLILHGDADSITPFGNAELLSQKIPDATVHRIPGGLHGFYFENLAANELAIKFFCKHRGLRTY